MGPRLFVLQCKTSFGMKALFELMNAQPRPFALFGDACTSVNEPVAMASKYWHIIHLSYAEAHAKFASADAQQVFISRVMDRRCGCERVA